MMDELHTSNWLLEGELHSEFDNISFELAIVELAFREIRGLVNDPIVIAQYHTHNENLPSYKLIQQSDGSFKESKQPMTPDEVKYWLEFSHDEMDSNLEKALRAIERQLVVSAMTHIELALNAFFRNEFRLRPQLMAALLPRGTESMRPQVDFTKVLNSSSREQLLSDLANSLSSNASKGGIADVIRRVEKMGGVCMIKRLRTDLINMQELRNRVVHQNSIEQVEVDSMFSIAYRLMKFLGQAAHAGNTDSFSNERLNQ